MKNEKSEIGCVNRFISQLIMELLLYAPVAFSPCIPSLAIADRLARCGGVAGSVAYVPSLITFKTLTVLLLVSALYYPISRIRHLINCRFKTSREQD